MARTGTENIHFSLFSSPQAGSKINLLNVCDDQYPACSHFFFSSSLFADGANQRATALPIPRVVTRDLPISPRFTPTSFYHDAGTALLHLVNEWLNFSSSRPHAFRYGNQKKNTLLLRLDLTNSDLVDVCCTHMTTGPAYQQSSVLITSYYFD